MQYHSEFNRHRTPSRDRTPWNIAERTGDARVLPIYRRFAELRERLVPYLAAQAGRCAATGKPLMRAPFFEATGDDRVWEFPYQWYLGDDLLVAPVTESGAARSSVYLPRGEWVDVWRGDALTGPAVVERAAPLEEIPVFVRGEWAAELAPLFGS
jgi:alpha-glucosidase (family GH31 glycosyl hydrolase)